ncbi:type II and III secretion system protein [Thermovirga lienii DSM 17291]|uniref:Type II and III secretion system protein n=1 Tax=Thermovirga lienii (strain ATCC BAA-1197 / DSM 17291 / Cas60314) TaxID=580340 RepID=G7V9P5_THELD|nr:secretin N-terminal domain-containing protein [Thermovirga lienii]AER66595.1 type II and III secretion system protein [Thermovirga lienii DSM 17291]
MGRSSVRGFNRNVRSSLPGVLKAVFVLTVLVAVFPLGGASSWAGDAPSQDLANQMPTMLGLEVTQAGGRVLLMEFKGHKLPLPEVLSTENDQLVLYFLGVTLPSGFWEKDYSLPLLRKVKLSQEDQGVKAVIMGNMPLGLLKVEGAPPSSLLRLYVGVPSQGGEISLKEEMLLEGAKEFPGGSKYDPMMITKPVTIEMRDADLRDVFRMLGTMMNINILVDPSVPSSMVTVSLKDVPFRDALQYLMRMYEITYAMIGKTMVVGKAESIAKTLGLQQTRGFHISYADPKQIPALLQSITGVTKFVVDERLRMVYVTGTEAQLDHVKRTLERIDHPGLQVMLQARIIEVSDDGKDEVEALVNAVYKSWWASFGASGGMIGYYDDNQNTEESVYDPDTDDRTIAPPGELTFPDLSNGALKVLDAGLRALESSSKAKVLASPSLVTVDGQPAEVKLTQNYIYQSGLDDNGNPEFETEEAGPILKFTPNVGRSGVVTIQLDIGTGQILEFRKSGQSEVPVTSKRNVKTLVRVRNGEPFVVGGLFSEQTTRSVTKIPVISDIPLLGELFKIRNARKQNTEVVIIVVPYILEVPSGSVAANF